MKDADRYLCLVEQIYGVLEVSPIIPKHTSGAKSYGVLKQVGEVTKALIERPYDVDVVLSVSSESPGDRTQLSLGQTQL